MKMHNPAHPGAVLREWLADISVTAAAKRLGVSRLSLSKVLNENGGISLDMDLRLSKALGTWQGFWYRMLAQWETGLA
jgi:addiction module HigA family antidote